jgi:hypothetical protein
VSYLLGITIQVATTLAALLAWIWLVRRLEQ